ncbi:hypothetical protein [Tenacibaculum jejuense]|uniref:DUF3887 domain-containing protein n=1 Tax=Tenacibaculum jejuense TaxID=584609 RepID=A0A238U7E1_9FLAO|nr:hypothetical protein [Tenacibaculum jejuense]SNR14404.1 exported protein of unknown function [Tenacibaculum jejuense]
MKVLYSSILVLFISFSVFSQSKEDYKSTLDLVKKAFNEKKSTLLHAKFDSKLQKELEAKAFAKSIDSLHDEKGNISTYELIMEDDKEKNYLVEFENGSMLIVLYLSPNGSISKFHIKDY